MRKATLQAGEIARPSASGPFGRLTWLQKLFFCCLAAIVVLFFIRVAGEPIFDLVIRNGLKRAVSVTYVFVAEDGSNAAQYVGFVPAGSTRRFPQVVQRGDTMDLRCTGPGGRLLGFMRVTRRSAQPPDDTTWYVCIDNDAGLSPALPPAKD